MKSVGAKFLLVIGLVTTVFYGFVLCGTSAISKTQTENLVRQQTSLALGFGLAIRPGAQSLPPEGGFEPEAMAISFVARSAFERGCWTTPWRRQT